MRSLACRTLSFFSAAFIIEGTKVQIKIEEGDVVMLKMAKSAIYVSVFLSCRKECVTLHPKTETLYQSYKLKHPKNQ